VSFIGAAKDRSALRDGLRRLAETDRSGQLAPAVEEISIAPIDQFYPAGSVVEPAAQVAAYAELTEDARRAGYSGLRVAVDVTTLVATPEQRDAFARYEHLIDRYMRHAPFAAMCAYDRAEHDEGSIAELACMHPVTNRDATLFRLHASPRKDCAASIAGELDMSTRAPLALALDRAELQPHNGELALDARHLEFIDHRDLLVLTGAANGARLVLRNVAPGLARLVKVMDVPSVRVDIV
jgi:hypothetical protein